jgi:ribosomal protein S18 acetylase RimI-like enzyme
MFYYEFYRDEFYNDLKDITLKSFKLTSFDTDYNLNNCFGGKIAWELWLKPALESERKKYCIICRDNNKAVGYLLFGAEASYSKALNKKIGTIILLAIDENYREKFNIAKNIINFSIQFFIEKSFKLITVGTDLNNLPAFITYINLGFRPILFWSTYRNYFDLKEKKFDALEIKYLNDNNLIEFFLENLKRPLSLLIDKKIENKEILQNFIKEIVKTDIQNKRLNLMGIFDNNECVGFFSFTKRNDISRVLNKNFVTIYDLIFLKENYNNLKILDSILIFLKEIGTEVAEVFIESDDFKLANLLSKVGFQIVHNAVVLHKHLIK